jgi:4-diphosphocytidyl-2-C-methyl-D-erythritol kinase
MEEPAFAKINLALHVRSREADGYHRIETVFAFVDAGDLLRVRANDSLILEVEGPFSGQVSEGEDNLVLRAAAALRTHYGVARGAALTLQKNLPVASGIGGGSADAAAALRLLARFWEIAAVEDELFDLAQRLGSDVPACLLSRPARGEGRGERLLPLEDWTLAGTPVLLANPGKALATADVFSGWDRQDRGPLADPLTGRNDLEPPALRLVPEIGDVLEALRETAGTRLVRMSGSGATCFALYESDAARDAALAHIGRTHPQWWLLASRLRG